MSVLHDHRFNQGPCASAMAQASGTFALDLRTGEPCLLATEPEERDVLVDWQQELRR